MRKFLALCVLLSGCAGYTHWRGWKPALDHATDKYPGSIAKDEKECSILDRAYVGTGLGDFSGADFSSIYTIPFQVFGSDKEYKTIFKRCMSGRGHKVLN